MFFILGLREKKWGVTLGRAFLDIRLISLAALWLSSELCAVELVFKNGDLLSGEVLKIDEEAVFFDSEILGEIVVPLEVLKEVPVYPVVNAVEPPPSPPSTLPEVVESVIESTEAEGEVDELADEAPRVIQLRDYALDKWASIWDENPFWGFIWKFYPLKAWNNQLNFGLSFLDSSTNEQKYNITYSTEWKKDRQEVKFSSQYKYTNVDSETTQNLIKGSFRYRFDFKDGFFVQSLSSYQRNPILEIYHEVSETIGLGYRWLEMEHMKGSLTPGIGLSYSKIGDESSVGEFIGTIVQDFSFDISETVKFTEEVNILYSPSENGDYVYSFQAGIENRITKSLSLNLLYDYTYDQRVSDENDRTEELISLSLGARF